jgi:hypothetical protein
MLESTSNLKKYVLYRLGLKSIEPDLKKWVYKQKPTRRVDHNIQLKKC